MKPHLRIRKTIKWGGAAVTVLLVVVWIGSGWWRIEWIAHCGFVVYVRQGIVDAGRGSFPDDFERFGLGFARADGPFHLWEFLVLDGRGWDEWPTWQLRVPVWVPAGLGLLASVFAWRLDALARRRAPLNLCPRCNYDRAGIAADAKCPECGSAAP